MSIVVERLQSELAALGEADRAYLAEFLLQTLDSEQPAELHEAWDAELRRRLLEIESGEVEGIPAEEVFEELRKEFP